MPEIIKNIVHTSKSIKACCLSCISLLRTKHINSASIKVFALFSMSKSRKEIIKFTFKCLMRAVYTIKDSISDIDITSLRLVFQSISWQLNAFKRINVTRSKKLCKYFFAMMGNLNFRKFIQSLVDEGVVDLMSADQLICVALQTENRKPPNSYQDFLKQNQQFINNTKHQNGIRGIVSEIKISKNQSEHFYFK